MVDYENRFIACAALTVAGVGATQFLEGSPLAVISIGLYTVGAIGMMIQLLLIMRERSF